MSDSKLPRGVQVRTPLEQYRIVSGLTYGRLGKSLGMSYYVARRLCRGERDPNEEEFSRMVTVGGSSLGVKAWSDFEPFYADDVTKYSFTRNTPPQFPLPSKRAVDSSRFFSTLYDDSNFRKQRQMVSISVDQLAFLDYLSGLSGYSRSAVVRRLIKYAKHLMAEGGTSMMPAPAGLKDDYFVEPDNPAPTPLVTLGSDGWAEQCNKELADFEEKQRKKREAPLAPSPEEITEGGDIYSEVELLRIQAEALSQGKASTTGWKPSVLTFVEDEEETDGS